MGNRTMPMVMMPMVMMLRLRGSRTESRNCQGNQH